MKNGNDLPKKMTPKWLTILQWKNNFTSERKIIKRCEFLHYGQKSEEKHYLTKETDLTKRNDCNYCLAKEENLVTQRNIFANRKEKILKVQTKRKLFFTKYLSFFNSAGRMM